MVRQTGLATCARSQLCRPSRCEYILYRGLYRTSYARLSRGLVTDTELQLARFVLPKHGFGVTNETVEARTLRAFKEELPKDHVSHEKDAS